MKTLLLTLTLTLIFMLATSLISMLWGAGFFGKIAIFVIFFAIAYIIIEDYLQDVEKFKDDE